MDDGQTGGGMIGYLIVAAVAAVVAKNKGWAFGVPTPVAPGGDASSHISTIHGTPVVPSIPTPLPPTPRIASETAQMSNAYDTPFLTNAHPDVANRVYPWQPNWRARQPGETSPPWAVVAVNKDGGPTKAPPNNRLLPGAKITIDYDWLTPVPPAHSGGGLPGGISPGGGGAPGGGGGGYGGGGHALK